MRIAMISVHACPLATREGKETGGLQVYLFELAKALGMLGHDVDIFTRKEQPSNPDIAIAGKNVRVIHLSMGPAKNISKKKLLPYIDDFVDSYLGWQDKHHQTYDIFHCHYYLSGIAGLKIQKISNHTPPLIMTFHTLGLMKNLVARSEKEKENQERIDAEKKIIDAFDAVSASSDIDAQYLEYLYDCKKEKISIIPPGIDTALFHNTSKKIAKEKIGANPNNNIILSIGRIEPLKGFDVLLYALKILFSKRKDLVENVCLWIVGGEGTKNRAAWSHEQKKLDRVMRELGLDASVVFVPQQPQEKLPDFYNASEMLVMPSHYESFGMVALEAMACETPVIASNVSGISRLLETNGHGQITTANNPILLATQIESILMQKTAIPKSFHIRTWKDVAEDSIKMYKSLQ
jgi:D-inositol-3-phosphate glycosyltransferase